MKNWTLILTMLLLLVGSSASVRATNVVYFVFAERLPLRRDSFVLPLVRTNDIAYVRLLLQDTNVTRRTPVFRIARGSDGINRDYVAVGAPQWSWHIAEFLDFTDQVLGPLGSRPTYVESHLDEWLASNQSGVTAFFHEPLFELLPAPLLAVSTRPTPAGLELSWTDLGVHYIYTVEVSPAAAPSNWVSAPGGAWPTNATNWVDPGSVTNQSRYYRVKAQLKNP
jgi:hypothetical protein